MTDMQGAVGLAQLAKHDSFTNERQKWAKYYREQLGAIPLAVYANFPE